MMKFGLLTAILDGWTFEEAVDIASEMGFKCLEVACWPAGKAERRYAGVSHIDVTNTDPAYIAEGEEQAIAEGEYPAETAYVDEETGEVFAEGEIEDFIEPAANPRYSLPDEDLSNSELPAEEAYAEIPEEEIPFAVETAEELPAEETAVWEDFAENGAEEVWNDPADPEKK